MRYPRMASPPLGAKGNDVRYQLQVMRGLPIGYLESVYRTLFDAGLILADWSAQSVADGNVAAWPDSINGLTFAQAVVAAQPVKAEDSFNQSFPGVTFDGVDDFMRAPSLTDMGLPVGATPGNIFVVAQKDPLTDPSLAASTVFGYGGTAAGSFRAIGKTSDVPLVGDGTTEFFDYAQNQWVGVGDDGTAIAVPAILAGIFKPAGYSLRYNGKALGTSGAPTLNTTETAATVGSDNGVVPAEFFAGTIGRIIVTPALTDAQIAQMEAALAFEYGLIFSLDSEHQFAPVPLD